MHKIISLSLFFACLLLQAEALHYTLVEEGSPRAEIIIGARPTRSAQLAAFELQHHIFKMTDARLPILAAPSGTGRVRLQVGDAKRAAGLKTEEYGIASLPGAVVMYGNDTPDYGKVDYSKTGTFPPLTCYFRSTMFAVYDFLEKSCGVRFYAPGDEGTVHPRSSTLRCKGLNLRRKPLMDAFRWCYWEGDEVKSQDRDFILLRHRWRENDLYGRVNHNIYSIYYRYWDKAAAPHLGKLFIEKHPEYFAQRKTNRHNSAIAKWQYPGQYVPSQLCYASQGPVDYFAEEANKVIHGEQVVGAPFSNIRKMPGMPFYYPIQPDDDGAICQCPACLKSWQTNPTAHHPSWINRIAAKARSLNPDLNIATLAYGVSRVPPKNLELHPAVSIQICQSLQSWYHPLIYRRQYGDYKAWVNREGRKRPLTLWLYLLDPVREAKAIHHYDNCFPMLYPWQTGQYMEEFVRDGIHGFFAETTYTHHQLEGYLLSRIAYDNSVSHKEILEEYFRKYYGGAGNDMKQVYRTLEEITRNPKNYPADALARDNGGSYTYGVHTLKTNWSLGTPARMAAIRKMLDSALAHAAAPLEKARVRRFIRQIWAPAEQGRKDYEKQLTLWKTPVPQIHLQRYVKEYAGDIRKADFSNAYTFRNWRGNRNEKLDPAPAARLKIIADSTHFYLQYSEESPDAYQFQKADFWTNGLEIFLGGQQKDAYLQIFAAADGSHKVLKHEIINGVARTQPLDPLASVVNTLAPGSWQTALAIPRTLCPPVEARRPYIKANFIRVKMFPDKTNRSFFFSPIFTHIHAQGLYRMGKIYPPARHQSVSRALQIQGDFKNSRGSGMPDGWEKNPAYPPTEASGSGSLRFSSPKKEYGHVFHSGFWPVLAGENVTFEFTASGKGACGGALYLFNDTLHFLTTQYRNVPLTDTPRQHRVTLTIPRNDRFAYPPTIVRVALMCTPGGHVNISNLKVTAAPPPEAKP